MKRVKLLGLSLVLTAFMVFMSVLVLSEFALKPEHIERVLDAERAAQVENTEAFESLSQETFSNSFSFSAALVGVFEEVNTTVLREQGISAELEKELYRQLDSNYDTALVAAILPSEKTFAYHKLMANTGWMVGRAYDSGEALQKDLAPKIAEVNQQILAEFGFEAAYQSDLKFSLSREALNGEVVEQRAVFSWAVFGAGIFGAFLMIIPRFFSKSPGANNDHLQFKSMTSRGWSGALMGIFLIAFYVVLYWWPQHITGWVSLVDPLSQWIKGMDASQWFLYGLLYTLAILVMGVRMFIRYRHNRYQLTRTTSVMFFQLFFAFLIPEILLRLNMPYQDFKNIWPLNYDLLFNGQLLDFNAYHAGQNAFIGGQASMYFLFWGVGLAVIAVPVFTYIFGKRWYCSWVCGCGGLAETAGDPYRHLSDNSVKSWKIERWMVHGVLVFAVLMTGLTLYTFFSGSWSVFGISTGKVQQTYGFLIGAAFAGVVGVGFYPFMGSRVWCRFGCPLAAYIGIVQRFKSRFRITTNGGQCISCGNCTVYCEMGIDVRWYAQRGQNIVRASCVGCGVCAAVCPRGVLKLENGPEAGRINDNPILIGRDGAYLSNEITGQH